MRIATSHQWQGQRADLEVDYGAGARIELERNGCVFRERSLYDPGPPYPLSGMFVLDSFPSSPEALSSSSVTQSYLTLYMS